MSRIRSNGTSVNVQLSVRVTVLACQVPIPSHTLSYPLIPYPPIPSHTLSYIERNSILNYVTYFLILYCVFHVTMSRQFQTHILIITPDIAII